MLQLRCRSRSALHICENQLTLTSSKAYKAAHPICDSLQAKKQAKTLEEKCRLKAGSIVSPAYTLLGNIH